MRHRWPDVEDCRIQLKHMWMVLGYSQDFWVILKLKMGNLKKHKIGNDYLEFVYKTLVDTNFIPPPARFKERITKSKAPGWM